MQEKDVRAEYEAPRIEDHGDLTELTEATHHGTYLDAAYEAGRSIEEAILTTTK